MDIRIILLLFFASTMFRSAAVFLPRLLAGDRREARIGVSTVGVTQRPFTLQPLVVKNFGKKKVSSRHKINRNKLLSPKVIVSDKWNGKNIDMKTAGGKGRDGVATRPLTDPIFLAKFFGKDAVSSLKKGQHGKVESFKKYEVSYIPLLKKIEKFKKKYFKEI